MPRTTVAAAGDGKPRRKSTAAAPWNIAPVALAKAQTCIRAAELRARSVSYKEIAAELGLESPLAAKKCAERGYGLAPGEDLRMARRVSAARLDQIMAGLWKVVDDPGMATTVSGKLVMVPDPETGEEKPMPDQQVRIAAYRALTDASKRYDSLHGTDAPRQSVSVVASARLEDLQAAVETMRAEVAQAEQEAAMEAMRGDDDDDPGGMLALPPGR